MHCPTGYSWDLHKTDGRVVMDAIHAGQVEGRGQFWLALIN